MSDKVKVGFIGVGLMGHGMARNLLEKGHPLVIKGNRNRAPVEDLVARGATEVATPREMAAACDVIHICLGSAPQVESVFRGEEGILAGMRDGLIVVECSTSDPNVTLALAAELGIGMTEMKELGHFPMSENPARFAEYLYPVLDRIAEAEG